MSRNGDFEERLLRQRNVIIKPVFRYLIVRSDSVKLDLLQDYVIRRDVNFSAP